MNEAGAAPGRRVEDRAWPRVLALALAVAALLAGLGAADTTYHMEVLSIASSHFTWLDQQTNGAAWWVPNWNGLPRINKPPLLVWVNLLAWSGLDPATASPDAQVLRARLAALAAALLGLVGTFLAGRTLGGRRMAWNATLIAATSLFFIRQARTASYDTYLFGFSSLAMAAGLAALRARGGRAAAAWAAAGVAAGAAWMAKGPVALVFAWLPLVALAALAPERRGRGLAGALAAGLAAALVAAPWHLWVLAHVPGAAARMGLEWRASRDDFQPPWYYLGLVPLLFPWLLFLLAGLADGGRRWREPAAAPVRTALVWFAVVFVVMSIPGAKQQRYLFPLLPAAALVAAWGLDQTAARRPWLQRATAILLLAAALAAVALGLGQEPLVARGAMPKRLLAPDLCGGVAVVGALLAVFAFALLRAHPARFGAAAALWMALAAAAILPAYARAERGHYRFRGDAERARALVGARSIGYFADDAGDRRRGEPDEKFFFYFRRPIPAWAPPAPAPDFVLARDDAAVAKRIEDLGGTETARLADGRAKRILFHLRNLYSDTRKESE